MLDFDSVEMARGWHRGDESALAQYVNDRPYVASSFMSTAISQVFGSALAGRCKDRPDLVEIPLPLEVIIEVLPVKGGEDFLRRIFEPLGYNVEAQQRVLDEQFPEWGDSPYFSVKPSAEVTLSALLNHLYILIPVRALEIAAKRLRIGDLSSFQADRIKLIHGSLMYRDKRLAEFDAAAVVEVIEHLDPPRLSAFERVLFQYAKPRTVVLTTPNAEYNIMWETLPAGNFRHPDHRFEWTRQEFQSWATRIGERFGFSMRFAPVGPEDERLGPPIQMGVFDKIILA